MQVQAAERLSLVRVAAPGSVVEFGKLVSFYRHDNKMNYTIFRDRGKIYCTTRGTAVDDSGKRNTAKRQRPGTGSISNDGNFLSPLGVGTRCKKKNERLLHVIGKKARKSACNELNITKALSK